jgi:pSer/pThr/pTyr-binding forkhead associated (FHA) protein/tetratricopeptide (TPR) repeat protein
VATLAVYRGDQFLREIEIGPAPTRIGRSPENELMLEDRDKGVSRTHAEIRYEHGQYVIVDLNSQNGVWIGDKRVKSDPLPVSMPVTIGPYRLVLQPATQPPIAVAGPATESIALPPEEEQLYEATELIEPDEVPQASAGTVPKRKTVPASESLPGAETFPVVKTPVQKKGALSPLAIAAAAAAVIVVGVVLAVIFRRSPVESTTTTAVTTSTVPATTTVAAPSGPTPEEQFLDHYNKAQELIAANDKAAAEVENAEALKILPSDPRGVQQQAAITAMKPRVNGAVTTTIPPAEKPTSSWTVMPRADETAAQRLSREKLSREHFEDGKKRFDEKRYSEAIELFVAAIKNSGREDFGPTPGEASNLWKQAQNFIATAEAAQKTARAQKLFDDAKALANSDLVGAVRKLRDARATDQQLPGVAEFLRSLQDKAVGEGEAALNRAKNLDAYKRFDEAIREYDRAVQLLELAPGGHKELQGARERLAELRKR